MTVIVWDGRILAADTLLVSDGLRSYDSKLAVIGGVFYGGAGSYTTVQEMFEYFRGKNDFPCCRQKSESDRAWILRVDKDKKLWEYEYSHIPCRISNDTWALGGGRDLAMGAMGFGANAVQAVQFCIDNHAECGGEVEFLIR